MNAKKILGENIKKYRKSRNLTQEELAEKLDISSNHLSKIEMGRRFVTAELMDHLAQELYVTLSALMFDPDDTKDDPALYGRIEKMIVSELDLVKVHVKEKLREK